MNPKQKAKELFDEYCYAIRTEETDSGYFTNVIYANVCAILAVEEVLKLGKKLPLETLEYYLEVKIELEKLKL